jgi:hypothetical protein
VVGAEVGAAEDRLAVADVAAGVPLHAEFRARPVDTSTISAST